MADWNTGASASNFDASVSTTGTIDSRSSQRSASGVGTHKGGFLWSKDISNLEQSSVVGINVNEIPNMRNAINDYCSEIENYVNGLNPEAEATMAFKSEEVNLALKKYMDDVKTYSINLVSQLRAFSDKLADVKSQWEAASQTMSETIGSTSGSNFATGTRYTETMQ